MVSICPYPSSFLRPSSASFVVISCVVMMMAAGCGDDSKSSLTAPSDAVIQAILSVAIAASATAVTEGDSVTFNIAATSSDGAAATGMLTVDLGDGRSVTVTDFLSTATVTETYSSAGSYTVTAQLVSDDGSTGTANVALSVTPRPILSVTLSASPTTPQVDEAVVFTVGGTSTVGAAAIGTLVMDYGDGTSTTVSFEDSVTTTKTYSAVGTYTVNAELTATDGRVANATLSLTIDEAPGPGGSGGDEIDLSTVTWLHHNVSGWTVTSTITLVEIKNPPVCIHHTKAGQWPVIQNSVAVEGNPWIFAKVGGKWYAGTYEWVRPGQICKGNIKASTLGDHIKKAPLDGSWRPKSGDRVGFMMSTPARFGPQGPKNERSNVVLMTWP